MHQALAFALRSNQTEAAHLLATNLLALDPKDPAAHYAMAVVHSRGGDISGARKASRRAFRHARSDIQSFTSASLSARLAYQDKSYTSAQYWLRRAHTNAPGEVQRQIVERDFKRVRARNPLRFRLDASIAPSSNVNNGSMSRYMIIDGVPVVGVNVGDAMALSGVEAMFNARVGYRLARNETSETRLIGRYFTRQVALSDEAKETAPNARGSDYAFSVLEGGLRHGFRLTPRGPVWTFSGVLGRSWYGGDALYDLARLEGGGAWQLNDKQSFSLTATREWRRPESTPDDHDVFSSLSGSFTQVFQSGSRLSANLSLNQTEDANPVFSSAGVVARLRYSFGDPLGPVRVSAALKLGYSDYPDYRVGFIQVPGGRQDKSVAGEVEMMFHRMHYAGFAPTMTVRALRTDSNVSRFDTEQVSVTFGIRSSF